MRLQAVAFGLVAGLLGGNAGINSASTGLCFIIALVAWISGAVFEDGK